MKNKIIRLILIAFLFIIFSTNVSAYGLCTSKKYSNLKSKAYKTEFSYELKFDENHNHYFEITVNNLDKDVILIFNGITYEAKDNGEPFTIETKLEDGLTYEFSLYGGYDTDCVEEFLYKKKLTIPKYNVYSERDECIEYEEFYMCNKWFQGEIPNDEYFKEKLNEYIESITPKKEEIKEEVQKNFYENIINFYTEHLVITLPITIIVLVLIFYKVIISII
mgnify:CR=1 FL=1